MFVSIAIDPGSEGRAKEIGNILAQYGLKKVQLGIWESAHMTSDTLDRIKSDLDKATDSYDKLRIYQYPLNGSFVITTLVEKRWRRLVARESEQENPANLGIVKRRD